jgi:hypothetical protein
LEIENKEEITMDELFGIIQTKLGIEDINCDHSNFKVEITETKEYLQIKIDKESLAEPF